MDELLNDEIYIICTFCVIVLLFAGYYSSDGLGIYMFFAGCLFIIILETWIEDYQETWKKTFRVIK